MASEVTLTIDTRQMQAALAQYLERSRHSIAFVINRKMFHIAKRAYDLTPVAKRQHILDTFNVSQRERTVKKGKHAGKIRRVTNYSGLTRSAYRIMNWKRRKKGLPSAARSEALKLTKKMIASRLRAVGSLKSGWIGAIVKLQEILSESFVPLFKNTIRRRGRAKAARPTRNPVGEIAYRLTVRRKDQEQIDPRVVSALQQAFDDEASDTVRHLASELQKEANKVNAR